MKLQPIQNITKIETLKPLRDYKALTTIKVSLPNIPSEIELHLLTANLLYQAKLILDGEAKRIGSLSAISCTHKAIEILKITDDYCNKYIDYKELKQIKKDFRLNGLYE